MLGNLVFPGCMDRSTSSSSSMDTIVSKDDDRSPIVFQHQLMLDDSIVEIEVDLNWIGSTDFDALTNLFLVRRNSSEELAELKKVLLRPIEEIKLVGSVVSGSMFTELVVYTSLPNLFMHAALDHFTSFSSDCYVTIYDGGHFYRSFMLPPDFRILSRTFYELGVDCNLAGRSCKVLYFTTLLQEQLNDKISNQLSDLGLREFTEQRIEGLTLCRHVEAFDVRSQHRDLAQLYLKSTELGFSIKNIEFDLR